MMRMLDIPRRLNLASAEDRLELTRAAASDPEMLELIAESLDEFLLLFPSELRTVYSGGMVSVAQHGFELKKLLQVTRMLQRLTAFPGSATLVAQLRNPTQLRATIFEVEAATWCLARTVTKPDAVEFSPAVEVRGAIKRPDFLWRTTLGDAYCECKQAQEFEGKLRSRVNRLFDCVHESWTALQPWPEGKRVDLLIRRTAGTGVIERELRDALASLHESGNECCALERVEATLAAKSELCVYDQPTDSIKMGSVTVPAMRAIQVADSTSNFTLTMRIGRHRERKLANLVRDARRQLPATAPGLIFVELGGVAAASSKLQELLTAREYFNTPWASLWKGGVFQMAVWRQGQPFDDRLIVGQQ
jgi:hypothetical protein